MPVMPKRPCTEARCRLMAVKGGRCDDHQPPPWKTSIGKSSTERGYGHAWRKRRKQALIRDNHLCQECIKNGIATIATEVDHIKAKYLGGDDSMRNLMSICSPCHKTKTSKESRDSKKEYNTLK
jgi:5-methylcytosine-specific restriction protein A